jgi:hypothetical protein
MKKQCRENVKKELNMQEHFAVFVNRKSMRKRFKRKQAPA